MEKPTSDSLTAHHITLRVEDQVEEYRVKVVRRNGYRGGGR